MRTLTHLIAGCLLFMAGFVCAQEGPPTPRKATHIEAQELGKALQTLAKDRGLQVLMHSDLVRDLRTPGAEGTLTTAEALERLLSGTGLTWRYLDEKTLAIVPASAPASSKVEGSPGAPEQPMRLAREQSSPAAHTARSAQDATNKDVSEVVVTAQKRSEHLQDVPVPVTALEGKSLVESGQVQLQEYYAKVPGLNFLGGGAFGTRKLAIRGLPPIGGGNSTVGVLVDDVPFGTIIGSSYGAYAPDIDPSELSRIEVLRGPQGTLYGSSTIGGLLKFVTADPSTEKLSGRVQVSGHSIYNGDGPGYALRASMNVPLGDTWAIRISGSTRREPGYIDDPVRGIDGINQQEVQTGRLAALWRPSDIFTLRLSALLQKTAIDGFSEVDPALGDLQQQRLRGTGIYDQTMQAYSAIADVRVGRGTLTSISGYNINEFFGVVDHTALQGPVAQTLFGVGGASYYNSYRTQKFSEELRFTVPLGARLEWMVGAFYTDEDTGSGKPGFALQRIDGTDPATGASRGLLLDIFRDSIQYTESAAFTNLTVDITDRFNIQFGGRQTRIKQRGTDITQNSRLGAGNVLTQSIQPGFSFSQDAFTYLVTPQLKISPELMIYARGASGFRAGGINSSLAPPTASPTYEPDKTDNYEIGAKGATPGGRFSFDTSVYYIDWKDLQARIRDPATGFVYFANGGQARSRGVELSGEARISDGLTISAWVVWNDSELATHLPPIPNTVGLAGDRLPYTSRWSGHLAVDQDFPVNARMTGFVGASLSYIGDRLEIFGPSRNRPEFPSYAQTDLRGGVRYDAWTFNAYLNNLGDKRGVLGPGSGSRPLAVAYTQPRTLGLSVTREF